MAAEDEQPDCRLTGQALTARIFQEWNNRLNGMPSRRQIDPSLIPDRLREIISTLDEASNNLSALKESDVDDLLHNFSSTSPNSE